MNTLKERLTLSVFRSLQENQGLFDFDTPITEDVFVVSDTAHIYQKRESDNSRRKRIKVVTKKEAMSGDVPNFDYEMLLQLDAKKSKRKTQFELNSLSPIGLSSKKIQALKQLPYICLNNHGRVNELTSHPIVKGDVIKLGVVFFEVLETHFSKREENSISKHFDRDGIIPESSHVPNTSANKTCRICLMDSQDDGDLISPCKCKGSCEFVHFSCLQAWIQSKVKKQENQLVSIYSLSKLECELCKMGLPNMLAVGDRAHSLVEFQWPNVPFIVLERLNAMNENGKSFIVLTPNDQEIRIGRGLGMDLKVNDRTISKVHSSITFKGNSFHLQDKGSRFGSLILLRKEVKFDNFMCIQAASKLYKFESLPRVVPPTN